jgi:hypothetical protein
MRTRMQRFCMAFLVLPAVATIPLNGQVKNEEYIRSAVEGAPERISGKAAVVRLDPNGKTSEIRKGTNGFTCALIPDASLAPVCTDQQGWRWLVSAFSKQSKPGNSQPGIAYMAKGGLHFETADGKIVMEPTAETKEVKEPPHWMILWPIDPARSGLPTRPNAGGTYVMWEGTPFAHLMIYQDPEMLEKE